MTLTLNLNLTWCMYLWRNKYVRKCHQIKHLITIVVGELFASLAYLYIELSFIMMLLYANINKIHLRKCTLSVLSILYRSCDCNFPHSKYWHDLNFGAAQNIDLAQISGSTYRLASLHLVVGCMEGLFAQRRVKRYRDGEREGERGRWRWHNTMRDEV